MATAFGRDPLLGPALAGLIALCVAACDSGNTDTNNTISVIDENAVLEAAEENAAALAEDDDLANEAAADEAADMDVFGGNAAAGEGGNDAPDLAADNDTAT